MISVAMRRMMEALHENLKVAFLSEVLFPLNGRKA